MLLVPIVIGVLVPIVIGALGTLIEGLLKEVEDFEIKGRVETI